MNFEKNKNGKVSRIYLSAFCKVNDKIKRTFSPVAKWARAVFEVTEAFGQER